jgi:hypothetical protein
MELVFGQKQKQRNAANTSTDSFPDKNILMMLPVNPDVKSPARRFEFNQTAIDNLNINRIDEASGEASNTMVNTCYTEDDNKELQDWHILLNDETGIKVGATSNSFSNKTFYDALRSLNEIEDDAIHYFELVPNNLKGYDVLTLREVMIDVEEPVTNSETVKLTEELV